MRTITVEGSFNARSFGERALPWLIRTATLDAVTVEGENTLRRLGVTTVLDLREDGERDTAIHGFTVRNIPLYQQPSGPPLLGTLESIYEMLLRTRGTQLAAAVGAIADSPGAVLVHCTAGKDRTGLVVALALLASGTSVDDVIADYVASEESVTRHRRAGVDALLSQLELSHESHSDALRLHLESPAEALQHALSVLDELGGASGFLRRNGLEDAQLSRLVARAQSEAS